MDALTLPASQQLQTTTQQPQQTTIGKLQKGASLGEMLVTDGGLPDGTRLVVHPLVLHKVSLLRDRRVRPKQVRELVAELTLLLAVAAAASLDLTTTRPQAESPVAPYDAVRLRDEVAIFPIMRAGIAMVDPFLNLMPSARVHHLGIYREKSTLLPVEYYNKLPSTCQVDIGYVVDPMVATAGTAIAAVNILKDWGLKRIKFVCIMASRSGIEALSRAHPDLEIFVAAIDDVLNDHGYIVPGLGDAGDRLFKTSKD